MLITQMQFVYVISTPERIEDNLFKFGTTIYGPDELIESFEDLLIDPILCCYIAVENGLAIRRAVMERLDKYRVYNSRDTKTKWLGTTLGRILNVINKTIQDWNDGVDEEEEEDMLCSDCEEELYGIKRNICKDCGCCHDDDTEDEESDNSYESDEEDDVIDSDEEEITIVDSDEEEDDEVIESDDEDEIIVSNKRPTKTTLVYVCGKCNKGFDDKESVRDHFKRCKGKSR
jgi:hypothetical protein